MNAIAPLRLKKNQEKRLKAGHLWIYSNEIDVKQTPLHNFQVGDQVGIETHDGKALGLGYINPHTLLCARLVAPTPNQLIDQHFIQQRLQQALNLREQNFASPFYRLVYGESDGLPGLVIDRYGNYLVAQIATAGMERLKEEIIAALNNILQPQGILWRNDSGARTVEGLPAYVELAAGTVPLMVDITENNAQFQIPLWKGQKTGWFYDHRDNRARMQTFVAGKRVLDLFSYLGSFAVQAAVAGADKIIAVDSSAQALEWLQNNAQINAVSHKVQTQKGDVMQVLKDLVAQKEQFDIVLLDPPAFIKRRKDIDSGYHAYQRINELAMRLVAKSGLLISSSCSLHFSRDMLMEVILRSSVNLKRQVQIIAQGHQALDHPVHPAIAETNYLKTFFCYGQ